MAIDWADNFQNYGTDINFLTNGAYAEVLSSSPGAVDLVDDPDPNISTTVLQILPRATNPRVRKVFTTQATIGASFRVWYDSLPVATNRRAWFRFSDNVNATICELSVNPSGQIELVNNAGVSLGLTTAPVIVANAWQHIEVKLVQGGAGASTCEVRVEGQTVLNLTGLTFGNNNNFSCLEFRALDGSNSGQAVYFKDLVIWNTLGAYNTDFLGSVSVYTLRPDGDVALNWTPSTGSTGWDLIDESDPDDANYISAGTGPIPSAYRSTLTDLPPDVTAVRGLMSVVRARKTDGGDGSLQVGIDSGPATDLGADRPMTTAFTYWADVSEENPDTSTAWTPATVNAAGLRINRTL